MFKIFIFKSKVPDIWQKQWEGPIETFAYFRAVMHRAENILNWKTQLANLNLFKVPIDLSVLFHPQTFLATLKQYTAVQKKTTTENLRLACHWSNTKSPNAVTIENLQLEGAVFQHGSLELCNANSPNVDKAPKCQIEWASEVKILI